MSNIQHCQMDTELYGISRRTHSMIHLPPFLCSSSPLPFLPFLPSSPCPRFRCVNAPRIRTWCATANMNDDAQSHAAWNYQQQSCIAASPFRKTTSSFSLLLLPFLSLLLLLLLLPFTCAFAQLSSIPCQRPSSGSAIFSSIPTALTPSTNITSGGFAHRIGDSFYSLNGILNLTLVYRSAMDPSSGQQVFCYEELLTGVQAPILRVAPGDELYIRLINELVDTSSTVTLMELNGPSSGNTIVCGSSIININSVNIHFHGLHIPPVCHADNVVSTIVNAGETYIYQFSIPSTAPAGLYAYHDHIHGLSESAVLGGASGAIIIEGIELQNSNIAGLGERVIILRDQVVSASNVASVTRPAWDVSINYVPILYPNYQPALFQMQPGERQIWRIFNGAADSIFELILEYDGVRQPIEVLAIDGILLSSNDGSATSLLSINQSSIVMGPFSRYDCVIIGPQLSVTNASLSTLNINTGAVGDFEPKRKLLVIQVNATAPLPPISIPANPSPVISPPSAYPTSNPTPNTNRTLYFSESIVNGAAQFYLTVGDVLTPKVYSPESLPNIITFVGSVEQWEISNRAMEVHVFHLHQAHFKLLAQNHIPIPFAQQQYMDVIIIPAWSGLNTDPFPSVTVLFDFSVLDAGVFPFHCHILEHADGGMMGVIQVVRLDQLADALNAANQPRPFINIYVSPTGSDAKDGLSQMNSLATLETALIAATSTTNNALSAIINLAAGKYHIGKLALAVRSRNITIIGSGSASVKQDGSSTGALSSSETILDCQGVDVGAVSSFLLVNNGRVVLQNVVIRNCTSASGSFGIITAQAGSVLTMNQVRMEYHTSVTGVVLATDSIVHVTSSLCSSSTSIAGGACLSSHTSLVAITNSTFQDNAANYQGGAIYADTSQLSISGSTFLRNTAQSQGGGIYTQSTLLQIQSSYFSSHTAFHGGALAAISSILQMHATQLDSNIADPTFTGINDANLNYGSDSASTTTYPVSEGGAIYLSGLFQLEQVFAAQQDWSFQISAASLGIATSVGSSTTVATVADIAMFNECILAAGSSTVVGPPIWSLWLNYCSAQSVTTCTNSTIPVVNGYHSPYTASFTTSCTTTSAPASSSTPSASPTLLSYISDSMMTSNSAVQGGALSIVSHGAVLLHNLTISNNYAYVSGGGVYLFSTPSLATNLTLVSNQAPLGGGYLSYTGQAFVVDAYFNLNSNSQLLDEYSAPSTNTLYASSSGATGFGGSLYFLGPPLLISARWNTETELLLLRTLGLMWPISNSTSANFQFLSGVSLAHRSRFYASTGLCGGCIYNDNDGIAWFDSLYIEGTTSINGAVYSAQPSTSTMTNLVAVGNTADFAGSTVYVDNTVIWYAANNTFINNRCDNGDLFFQNFAADKIAAAEVVTDRRQAVYAQSHPLYVPMDADNLTISVSNPSLYQQWFQEALFEQACSNCGSVHITGLPNEVHLELVTSINGDDVTSQGGQAGMQPYSSQAVLLIFYDAFFQLTRNLSSYQTCATLSLDQDGLIVTTASVCFGKNSPINISTEYDYMIPIATLEADAFAITPSFRNSETSVLIPVVLVGTIGHTYTLSANIVLNAVDVEGVSVTYNVQQSVLFTPCDANQLTSTYPPSSNLFITCTDHLDVTLLPTSARAGISTFNWILACGTICCALITYHYRTSPIFKAASVNMLYLIAGAALLVHIAVQLLIVSPVSKGSCETLLFTAHIGFTTIFGTIWLKTWRIARIFHSDKHLKVVMLNDTQLLLRLLGFILPMLLFNLLRLGINPSIEHLRIIDGMYYSLCDVSSSSAASWLWLWFPIFGEALLVLHCVRLALLVKDAPDNFNESKFLGVTVYNTIIMAALIIFLTLQLNGPHSILIAQCVGILVGMGVSLALLYGGLIYGEFSHKHTVHVADVPKSGKQTSSPLPSGGSNAGVSSHGLVGVSSHGAADSNTKQMVASAAPTTLGRNNLLLPNGQRRSVSLSTPLALPPPTHVGTGLSPRRSAGMPSPRRMSNNAGVPLPPMRVTLPVASSMSMTTTNAVSATAGDVALLSPTTFAFEGGSPPSNAQNNLSSPTDGPLSSPLALAEAITNLQQQQQQQQQRQQQRPLDPIPDNPSPSSLVVNVISPTPKHAPTQQQQQQSQQQQLSSHATEEHILIPIREQGDDNAGAMDNSNQLPLSDEAAAPTVVTTTAAAASASSSAADDDHAPNNDAASTALPNTVPL